MLLVFSKEKKVYIKQIIKSEKRKKFFAFNTCFSEMKALLILKLIFVTFFFFKYLLEFIIILLQYFVKLVNFRYLIMQ